MNELLWVLRIDMIEEMIADLTSVTFNKADPIEEILDAFFCYLDYFFKHPNVFRFFYFYPFIQLGEDDRFHQIEQRFQGILQKSFKRLIQEGVIQPENVQIVAKTIIYALLGMIMLSFSSNGSLQNKDIKVELTTLLGYLLKKNNATN
jgi:AcrR family transcriptional regulator